MVSKQRYAEVSPCQYAPCKSVLVEISNSLTKLLSLPLHEHHSFHDGKHWHIGKSHPVNTMTKITHM